MARPSLFGSYKVDREGVMAKPLRLIEKGVLKNYLLTRQPVRGFEGSNGRARLPGASAPTPPAISNLFVEHQRSRAGRGVEEEADRTVQTRNKPYGIIVRKMDFPSTAGLDEVRRHRWAGSRAAAR